MSYSASVITDYLVENGTGYSHLKIQKLLYLANMIYMGRNNGKRLIKQSFEAWDYGPVIPYVYHALKKYGSKVISYNTSDNETLPEGVSSLLDEVIEKFGGMPASSLVAITHRNGSAWEKIYDGSSNQIINDVDILEEFKIVTS